MTQRQIVRHLRKIMSEMRKIVGNNETFDLGDYGTDLTLLYIKYDLLMHILEKIRVDANLARSDGY